MSESKYITKRSIYKMYRTAIDKVWFPVEIVDEKEIVTSTYNIVNHQTSIDAALEPLDGEEIVVVHQIISENSLLKFEEYLSFLTGMSFWIMLRNSLYIIEYFLKKFSKLYFEAEEDGMRMRILQVLEAMLRGLYKYDLWVLKGKTPRSRTKDLIVKSVPNSLLTILAKEIQKNSITTKSYKIMGVIVKAFVLALAIYYGGRVLLSSLTGGGILWPF